MDSHITKPKSCRICKQKFVPTRSTLEVVCPEYDCRVSFALAHAAKSKAANEKKERAKTKELKEKLKSLSDWKNDLQKEINQIVRLIDKGHPCIATKRHNGQMHAGHYYSVGSNPTLRYHLENIWLQSAHSNSWKSGDTLRYQQGIVDLYGQWYLDYMNSLQETKPIKLTISMIQDKIFIARGIIKWIKLQDRKFSNEERITLRQRFNNEIGIYHGQ